jgi:hypothetical protein
MTADEAIAEREALIQRAMAAYGFSATEAADWIDRFGSDQPEQAA